MRFSPLKNLTSYKLYDDQILNWLASGKQIFSELFEGFVSTIRKAAFDNTVLYSLF